jgi:hypothetical protein
MLATVTAAVEAVNDKRTAFTAQGDEQAAALQQRLDEADAILRTLRRRRAAVKAQKEAFKFAGEQSASEPADLPAKRASG